jgi:hypothetical protein
MLSESVTDIPHTPGEHRQYDKTCIDAYEAVRTVSKTSFDCRGYESVRCSRI